MAEANLKKGDSVGKKYEVIGVLSQSERSTVYLAEEKAAKNRRAIKEIWSGMPEGEEKNLAKDHFVRELRILGSLEEAGIPRFTEGLSLGSWHYLVMEYIDGETLEVMKKLRGRPFPVKEVIHWGRHIARTLHYLHNRETPIVHKNLQPAHLVVSTDGAVKLIDFGIARFFCDFKLKDTFIMGTPGFAAPEQYGKKQTTHLTDIYALGATLYALLTDEDPQRFVFNFPPLRKFNREVPPWLEKLIARCLEEDPRRRPRNAFVIREELEKKGMKL
ncbi:MAG: serine/threonine-protein kinase [Candidatus Eremiobacteraeota bacterium]|nr:serine/threonine-protein kinase [Candidatus Eremiobacteraeota bacterium]